MRNVSGSPVLIYFSIAKYSEKCNNLPLRREIVVSCDLFSFRYRQMPLVPRSWSLSRKRHSNGHMYYYKQTGDKTCYVRRRDESQVLAEYDERQKWRQERKELNQQLMSLSPAERREARQQMRLYQELGLEKLPLDKDISFDGTVLDSRAEIILYEFLKNLGIKTEHNRPIDSGSYSYWPDFTFTINGKRVYLEHMGKLDDPQYRRKQIEKIKNYKTHDIRLGENLVITSSHRYFQAPRVLWQLVIRGVLSESRARKLIKKNKNDNSYYWSNLP